MRPPDKIYLYRITHIDNLDYILKTGRLTCPNHKDANPEYIGIGDNSLIRNRSVKQINIEPFGTFDDYIAFYFGSRSPMLYEIQNGYNGVVKRNPQEIIYLVTTFEKILESKMPYVFTDGHAYHSLSQFFNNPDGLNEVDWNTIKLKQWYDTEDDPDRKRRKQAEFLVYKELPVGALGGIIVYTEAVRNEILIKFADNKSSLPVAVKPELYY